MGNARPYVSPARAAFLGAWPSLALIGAILAAALAGVERAAAQGGLNPAGVIIHREHDGPYKGGRTAAVTVFIAAAQWDGMTAMGLYERIPAGWTLAGLQTIAGPAPAVTPEPGAGGVLQFIWITPPRTPLALRYTLNVPPRDAGPRPFSGQVEYRLDAGKLVSGVALSEVDGFADEAPVIQLRGGAEITVAEGREFVDPGADATDAEDGDLSARVERTGQVDTDTPGAYTLVYNVTDSVGNPAASVERAVRVIPEAPDAGGSGGGAPARPGSPTPGSPGPRPAVNRPRPPAETPAPPGFTGPLPDIVVPEDAGNYALPKQDPPARAGASNHPEAPGATAAPTATPRLTPGAADATASAPAGLDGAIAPRPADKAPPGADALPAIAAAGLALALLGLVLAGCWTARNASRKRRAR